MGFINRWIPLEKKVFDVPGFGSVDPGQLTINDEKNGFMFYYWTNIDHPAEQYFAFYWKDVCFNVIMEYSFIDDHTIKWELSSVKQLDYDNEVIDMEEVKKDLRDAFMVYGIDGFEYKAPNAVPQPEIKVVCDF